MSSKEKRRIQRILDSVAYFEEMREIERCDDRADIACELAGFSQRKEGGYYD